MKIERSKKPVFHTLREVEPGSVFIFKEGANHIFLKLRHDAIVDLDTNEYFSEKNACLSSSVSILNAKLVCED